MNPLGQSQLSGEPRPGPLDWFDMVQWTLPKLTCLSVSLLTLFGTLAFSPMANAQSPFQIVWVVIGEASSASDKAPAHAGRQLFMASDLVSRSLANVRVEQVEVEPVIQVLAIGQRLCVTQLSIRATGPGRQEIGGAPLSISVRQDHKQRLGLSRSKRDICLQPNEAGEYPVRLTSLLPARDGTTRGAQVFVRVNGADRTEAPSETTRASGIP